MLEAELGSVPLIFIHDTSWCLMTPGKLGVSVGVISATAQALLLAEAPPRCRFTG